MQAGSDAPWTSVLATAPAVWDAVAAAGSSLQRRDSVCAEGRALGDLGEDSDKERNTERVSRHCFAGRLQCLPQALFPSVLSHGGSCPGDFRRELLRCACQLRWTSLEACSSNTHTEKKKSRLFLTLRQFYSESSFVLWLFLDCQIAVSALHKAPKTSRLWGMARMGHYRARTTLPFRGEKLKDVG